MRINYNDLIFEWDEEKHVKNIKKHNVTFLEGITVFDDDNALYDKDDAHSDEEERFVIIGESDNKRLLLVCHCLRERNAVVRVFSARKANRREKKKYGGER